jgi:hypothetical protein
MEVPRTQGSSLHGDPADMTGVVATERAIDLSIRSGLFLASRRVLRDMAAELKWQSQVISMVSRAEEVEERKAA